MGAGIRRDREAAQAALRVQCRTAPHLLTGVYESWDTATGACVWRCGRCCAFITPPELVTYELLAS